MQDQVQTIYGYVDLTTDARKWIKYQISKGDTNRQHFGFGWSVVPSHFRENPLRGILVKGYPDTDESTRYVFDNPENRDKSGDIQHTPLPLNSKRDMEWFREENEKMKGQHGFWFYKLFKAQKSYIEAYNPEDDYSENIGRKPEANIVDDSPVDELVNIPAELPKRKPGRPKKTENVVV